MKIDVDRVRCEGHGLCAEQAPSLFVMDDEGELVYAGEGADVPDELVSSARAAVAYCPVAALKETP
jgi:ferredoxin